MNFKSILLLTFLFISTNAYSQVNFGVGGTYLNDLGIQVRSEISTGSFDVVPKISYFFIDGATALTFDLDAQYDLVKIGESNPLYVFAGPLLSRISVSGNSSSDLGFNLGAGLRIEKIYGEIRYTTVFCDDCNGNIGFAAGYMF